MSVIPAPVWAATLLWVVLSPLQTQAAGNHSPAPEPDWTYVEKKLNAAKMPKAFINDMRRIYNPKDFLKVLEMNILLYLRNTDYHQPQVSTDAVTDIKKFLDKNKGPFADAEKKYSVSAPTISALLWLESRHGANKGSFHVASVFLHLVQADRPTVQRYLKASLPKYTTNYDKGMQAKITKRSKAKADWAMAEIKAMAGIDKKDRNVLKNLKGSFSGAFGMSQFLPSSYLTYAKPYKKGHSPDLSKSDDAIVSVANYLKLNGWRNAQARSHKRALMRYNNSEDYAKAILSLASRAGPPLASAPKPNSKQTIREAAHAHSKHKASQQRKPASKKPR